jgi:hypothetical protein
MEISDVPESFNYVLEYYNRKKRELRRNQRLEFSSNQNYESKLKERKI